MTEKPEITQEMIEAGAKILEDFYDAGSSGARRTAELIFKTMRKLSPRPNDLSHTARPRLCSR